MAPKRQKTKKHDLTLGGDMFGRRIVGFVNGFEGLGRFKQLRETRRIRLHYSSYLETPGSPSYVHFCEKVNE